MMKTWKTGMLSVFVVVIAAGCGDPSHKQAMERRVKGMDNTLRVMQSHEAQRGNNLQKTLNVAAGKNQEDVRRTSQAPAELDELIKKDFEHWRNREPYRQEVIREQLEGKPANIEQTVPRIIY